MADWQPISTAPKDGSEFLATNGVLLGIGYHFTKVHPETVLCTKKWQKYHESIVEPFRRNFQGASFSATDYLEMCRLESEAWEAAKSNAPPFEDIPNPRAGEVEEWDSASACFAYDGETEVYDYDGPTSFTPTHWQPLPPPPEQE